MTYEKPEVLATYSVDELAEEAALCIDGYDGGVTVTVTIPSG
jgi:hypothetical protein